MVAYVYYKFSCQLAGEIQARTIYTNMVDNNTFGYGIIENVTRSDNITYGNYLGGFTERVVYMVFFPVLTVEVLLMNGLLYLTVARCGHLQTPHLQLLCANSLSDVMVVLIAAPFVVALLFMNSQEAPPAWLCRFHGTLRSTPYFVSIHFIMALSFERYQYFMHPLKYPQRFNKRNIKKIFLAVSTPGILFAVFTEVFVGRTFHAVVLDCMLPFTTPLNLIIVFLFGLPNIIINIFCIVSLLKLLKKQRRQVQALQIEGSVCMPGKAKRPVKDAVRLILLVSGIFYGSYVPAYLIHEVIFRNVTWESLNARDVETLSVLYRVFSTVASCTPACLNPWVYIYVNQDLRKEMYKSFSMRKTQLYPT